MRKLVVLILGAAFLAAPSLAFPAGSESSLLSLPKDWDRADTALLLTADTLHLIDWAQTLQARKDGRHEGNVILGKHPSIGAVNFYMGGTLVALNLATISLPQPWRNIFQGIWIGVEGHSVVWNYRIGIRF